MADKRLSKGKSENTYFEKKRRRQQILFAILAAILIISWILSLVVTI